MPTRVEHSGELHDRWSVEAVCNIIGATLLVFDGSNETSADMWTTSDGDRFATSLVSV